MKEDKVLHLRSALEQMSDEQLGEMLREELRQDPPNENAVRLILSVLEDREKDRPVETTPQIDEAWAEYLEHTQKPVSRPRRTGRMLRAASIAAALAMVIAVIPQTVAAESLWERLARWTDSIFEFFNSSAQDNVQQEYVFQTDNPGLQEVYDTITELGVTDPVVPMWLPDGYELEECRLIPASTHTGVNVRFADGNQEIVFTVDIYDQKEPYQYQKDGNEVSEFQYAATTHYIMHNNDMQAVVWTKNHIECFLTIDCQEDTLHKILKSIYVMEE